MMKTISVPLLFICLFAFSFSHAQQKGTIVAKVFGFESAEGNLEITLYNTEKGFPEELEYSVETKVVEVKSKDVVVVKFSDLPMGDYAIAGHHDANGNGEMDYNWIGIPKEGYCFSNDVKPVLSAPSYKSAMFDLKSEKHTVYIHMQN